MFFILLLFFLAGAIHSASFGSGRSIGDAGSIHAGGVKVANRGQGSPTPTPPLASFELPVIDLNDEESSRGRRNLSTAAMDLGFREIALLYVDNPVKEHMKKTPTYKKRDTDKPFFESFIAVDDEPQGSLSGPPIKGTFNEFVVGHSKAMLDQYGVDLREDVQARFEAYKKKYRSPNAKKIVKVSDLVHIGFFIEFNHPEFGELEFPVAVVYPLDVDGAKRNYTLRDIRARANKHDDGTDDMYAMRETRRLFKAERKRRRLRFSVAKRDDFFAKYVAETHDFPAHAFYSTLELLPLLEVKKNFDRDSQLCSNLKEARKSLAQDTGYPRAVLILGECSEKNLAKIAKQVASEVRGARVKPVVVSHKGESIYTHLVAVE